MDVDLSHVPRVLTTEAVKNCSEFGEGGGASLERDIRYVVMQWEMQCADKRINTRMAKTSAPSAGVDTPELHLFKNNFRMSDTETCCECCYFLS